MTVKKILLFAFVLSLSLAKAQTAKIVDEFDEGKAIAEARQKGILPGDINGYVRAARARFVNKNHQHTESEYLKKVTVINMNTRQVTQSVQSSLCGNSDLSLL